MKKKLLFFLLTVVCTLLCAPPNAFAWNLGPSFTIKVRGEGFKCDTESAEPGWSDGYAMKWNSTTERYETKVTPTKTSLKFKFYFENDWRSPSSVQTSSYNNNPSYSGQFWGNGVDLEYTGITIGKTYWIYIKPVSGNPTYAFCEEYVSWDFSGNTHPQSVKIDITGGGTSPFNLDYDAATKTWSKEFTPTNHWIDFWVVADGTKFGNGSGKTAVDESWHEVANVRTDDLYHSGLTAGVQYLFELKGGVADKPEGFKWRITPVTNKVATPTFSPAAGKVNQGTQVTISCATSDATIYYTTDGNTPTTASTKYTGAITIDAAKTINAFAVKEGMTASDMATAAYTVEIPYDFSSNTKPSKITIQPSKSTFATSFDLDYNATTKIWSKKFNASNPSSGYVNFSIKADDYTFYDKDKGTGTLGVWVTKAKGVVGGGNDYYQGGITAGEDYIFELRASEGETSNFDWRIYKYVDPSKQHTVSVDLSQMGSGKWTASNVHAFFKNGSTDLNEWPGMTGTVNGDIVTFTFTNETTPTTVVFNNGNSGGANQSIDLNYIKGHTYILKSQVGGASDASWQTDAGQPVAAYNLPYGPNDFTEAKYFLVGSRMGMWRLQPEWELIKQADGSYKIDGGRYMFHGHFAVAKVQDFASYSKHQYKILSTNTNTSITHDNKSISNLREYGDKTEKNPVYYNAADGTDASNKALSFRYIGTGDDFNNAGNDKGTWCKEITFKDGTISFDIDDSDPNMASERVFTLVGENIYHNDYASGTDINGYTTPREQTGWQESWIQYGPNGRPYFDAHHEYLYHTAYVPSILNSTSVNFQIDVNGKNFDYSSKAVTFVEKEHLTNLSTDKYRELYDYFIQHPEAVTSGATVQGGNEADGTAFNFTLGTLPEFVSENAKWQVYVVRDAWVKGQFKIWNGWGGNSINNEGMGGTDTGARWNTLNGGPVNTTGNPTQESQPTDVILTDVNAGPEAQGMNKVYMNQGTGSNWKTENGELQYYNRIILLYNTAATDRLANSFVLFIQDDTAPVIKAFLEGADNNKGYVEWNLQNVKTGSEAVITGYTITRYRVTDEGNINPTVVKTESGLSLNVTDLTSVTEATTVHHDVVLNPGQYQYHIVVNYQNGEETGTREAYSNRIRVLGADIYPEVRVEQLVSLTAAGCTSDVLTALGESAYRPGQMYLTYRDDNPTADYYVLTTSESDNITNVEQVAQIDTDIARAILSDPNNYVWCARFYVRALDYTQYKHYYERQGLTCSEPQITITDQAAVEAIEDQHWTAQNGYTGKNIPTQQYQVKLTSGAVNTYIGAFIDRSGLLYAGEMRADMSYTFNTGSEDKPVEHNHTVNFTPVVANPYDLSAKFESRIVEFGTPIRDYVIEKFGEENVKGVGDFTANITFRTTPSSDSAPEDLKTIDVVAKESDIPGERHLDCVISFLRPNLSNNILSNYNIYYTIKVTSKEEEGLTEQDKLNYQPVEISGQYYDAEQTSDINPNTGSGSKRPYQVKITDVHPSGMIYPHFEITGVEYRRINGTTVTEHTLATNHSYGPLVLDAKNKPEHETTVEEFALGWNEGRDEDGNIDASRNRWLLYGHKDLKHSATPDADNIDISEYPSSRLFLLEISDDANGTVNHDYSPILWKHEHAVADNNPLYIETVPFLIGSLPKNNANITPSVTATPLYLFHRNPESQGVTGTNVIDLTPVPSSASSVKRRAASATINPDKLKVTKDEHGIVTGASYDATAAEYFMVTKSVPVTVAPEKAPVMTGIEDIVDDANAEAVYYNLQGIQVAKPEHGKVYIRVSGRTAEKVIY
ncbi:MAG: chitobiase/beta-hexosaminidase C-terminal domain-containing protein [Muribaculaceae bacterium]